MKLGLYPMGTKGNAARIGLHTPAQETTGRLLPYLGAGGRMPGARLANERLLSGFRTPDAFGTVFRTNCVADH
jgi:hypothetical protein